MNWRQALPDLESEWSLVAATLAQLVGLRLAADPLPGDRPLPSGYISPAIIRAALRRDLAPHADPADLDARVDRLFGALRLNGEPINSAFSRLGVAGPFRSGT